MFELAKVFNLPPDKSVSHRILFFSALSTGKTKIKNCLISQDIICTIECLRKLGVTIEIKKNYVIVDSLGINNLKIKDNNFYVGNSNTLFSFLIGILSGFKEKVYIDGDISMRRRNQSYILNIFKQLGCQIKTFNEKVPIEMSGGIDKNINVILKKPSAQIKTALFFAMLFYGGSVEEIIPTRDHTEQLIKFYNLPFEVKNKKIIALEEKTKEFKSKDYKVYGDPSYLAVILTLVVLYKLNGVVIKDVEYSPSRFGFYNILKQMGMDLNLEIKSNRKVNIKASFRPLIGGFKILKEQLPEFIDEISLLALVGTKVKNGLIIECFERLRHKESDRIDETINLLKLMGAKVFYNNESIYIKKSKLIEKPFKFKSLDHRLVLTYVVKYLKRPSKDYQYWISTSFGTKNNILDWLKTGIYK